MSWNSTEVEPPRLVPCVVLVRNMFGFWDRRLAQYDTDRGWYYMGSTEKLRDVEFWIALPPLPKPVVAA